MASVRGHSRAWRALSAACALAVAVLAASPGGAGAWGLLDWQGRRKPSYAAFKRG